MLNRAKKHIKYSRRVKLTKDGPSQKQTVTLSKTSSDWRAEKNPLSLLRRLDGEVLSGSSDSVIDENVFCSECHKFIPAAHFSKTQRKKGPRSRRCKDCVSESRLM